MPPFSYIHVLIVALVSILSFSAIRLYNQPDPKMMKIFEEWMSQLDRTYHNDTEKLKRFKIFLENHHYIKNFNEAPGKSSYTLSHNEFTDMTHDEFVRIYASGEESTTRVSTTTPFRYGSAGSVPSSVDWRNVGAVTAIKNQKQCGSCWAFSAAASVEAIRQIKTGDLVSLSEQMLVDCDTSEKGCNGGLTTRALSFIISNGGIASEADYPYYANQSSCNTTVPLEAKISGYERVPTNNETAIKLAVANQPISISIDASGKSFQHYGGGLFDGNCSTKLNHAINIVGYGAYSDGTEYWIARNSWGTSWGDKGYIYFPRDIDDVKGTCGLAIRPSYPVY